MTREHQTYIGGAKTGGSGGSALGCAEDAGLAVVSLLVFATRCEEIARHDAGERWCFGCRRRLPHEWVVWAPIEPSYYGPHLTLICTRCGRDRTRFPA